MSQFRLNLNDVLTNPPSEAWAQEFIRRLRNYQFDDGKGHGNTGIVTVEGNGIALTGPITILNYFDSDAVTISETPAGTAKLSLTQYTRNLGRSGGQIIHGGRNANENLVLEATANATQGVIGFFDPTLAFWDINGLGIPRLNIGGAPDPTSAFTPGGILQFFASGDGAATGIGVPFGAFSVANDRGKNPDFFGIKARGTFSPYVPLGLQDKDLIFQIDGLGFDNTNQLSSSAAGTIIFAVNGTPAGGQVPGLVSIRVNDLLGSKAVRLTVMANGTVGIGQNFWEGGSVVPPAAFLHIRPDAGTNLVQRIVDAPSGQTLDLDQWIVNSTVLSKVDALGAMHPPHVADATAQIDSVYYSTDEAKVGYKDSGSVFHPFYPGVSGFGSASSTVALSGASVTLTGFIPAAKWLLGVFVTITGMTGASSLQCGTTTDLAAFGNAITTVSDPTTFAMRNIALQPSALDVVLTANGSNFTGGSALVKVIYIDPTLL